MSNASSVDGFFCPHCGERLATESGHTATRCPKCRLIVGAGRAMTGDQALSLSAGSSAGTRMNAAKRVAAEPVDPLRIAADLTGVAARLGHPLVRLRMVDYDADAQQHLELVGLPQILATFGSWKAARAAAVVVATRSGALDISS